jgi:uncharacterized protein (DUF433 family)
MFFPPLQIQTNLAAASDVKIKPIPTLEYYQVFDQTRITFDPKIMAGQACIRGMRIPASLVINLVAHGKSCSDIVTEYPDLENEDISAALMYAVWLAQDRFVEFGRAS